MRKSNIIPFIFFFIFGLFFSTIGGTFLYNNLNIIKNGELVTGKIIDYSISYSKSNSNGGRINNKMYSPVIEYTCSGKNYTQTSNISSSSRSYNIGEKIDIYCLGNKYVIKKGFEKYFGLAFLIPGIIVFLIPFFMLMYQLKIKKLQEELKRLGDYIKGNVTFIGYNKDIRINGKNPMYFECEYLDKNENKVHIFKSKNFWHSKLKEFVKIGDERKIYVNRKNMKKYFIDIDDIPEIK